MSLFLIDHFDEMVLCLCSVRCVRGTFPTFIYKAISDIRWRYTHIELIFLPSERRNEKIKITQKNPAKQWLKHGTKLIMEYENMQSLITPSIMNTLYRKLARACLYVCEMFVFWRRWWMNGHSFGARHTNNGNHNKITFERIVKIAWQPLRRMGKK